MKTFDEALEELTKFSPETDAVEFCARQSEFGPDIDSSEATRAMSIAAVAQVVALCEAEGVAKVSHLADKDLSGIIPALAQCWLNGVVLGVAVGVRMNQLDIDNVDP